MGASFSVVNVNPKFARRVTENIASYGLSGRLASIDRMQVERAAQFDRAFDDAAVRDAVIEQFRDAARLGLAKGAECVIPAGGIVMTILADAAIHEVDGAPVVNGLYALVKIGELAVNMRTLTGGFTSKRLTYAPPTGSLLDDIRRAYGADIYPGAR
jgi:Asp/Glu/hydantoin racemase